nr:hypothetical protein Iba_chr15bCG8850 [Ipomoea batatas]GMD99060.1 hypothetical protein Iba_chr15eCG0160 [Ipomoea batatas]
MFSMVATKFGTKTEKLFSTLCVQIILTVSVLGAPLQTSSKTRVVTSTIKGTYGIGTKRAVFFMFPI